MTHFPEFCESFQQIMKGRRRKPLNLQPDKSVRNPGTHAGSLSEDSFMGLSHSPTSV